MWHLTENGREFWSWLGTLYNLLLIINNTIYLECFGKIKVILDVAAHSEHGQLIWCDIWPRSVERSVDVENAKKFRKWPRKCHQGFFQTPRYFLEDGDCNLKKYLELVLIYNIKECTYSFFIFLPSKMREIH
jgi:hypothetical protein